MEKNQEFEQMRQEMMQNPMPQSSIESAVYLIKNSKVTDQLAEVEKEIKLANLDSKDKDVILKLFFSYQDMFSLKEKYLFAYEEDLRLSNENQSLTQKQEQDLKLCWENFSSQLFDGVNHLRRAISIATVSRGKGGFEREQQNTVINSQNYNGTPPELAMSGMSGMNSGGRKLFGGVR